MFSRLPLIALLASMSASAAQAQTPPAAPSAREVVERQLAKPAQPPSQTPKLSAAEAQAIRERLILRIGQDVQEDNTRAMPPPARGSSPGQ